MVGFCSEAKTITIKNIRPIQGQFSKENVTYKINTIIDLEGNDLILPKGSLLQFKRKGLICNGRIIGNNTRVTAKERIIFDNIRLEGHWDVPTIYVSWMHLSKEDCLQQVQEIMKLQNPLINNTIYTPSFSIRWTPRWDNFSLFKLESKAVLNIRDTVYTNPNNRPYYRVVDINNKNEIEIIGGVLVGDVEQHTYDGTTSHQWGFGVNIEGSNNIEINGTTSMLFTGDGFYIGGGKEEKLGENKKGCNNITIKQVRSLYNRRQGMSVTGATDHLYVYDSEFSYTGARKLSMPGAGVDFEVNYDTQRMTDIFFKNCVIKGNRKGLCLLNKKGNGSFVFDNIIIDSSPFFYEETQQYELYPFRNAVISGDYESITFNNCQLGAISNMTTHNQQLPNVVNINNSSLSIIYTRSVSESFLRSFILKDCTIDIANKKFIDQGIHDTETPKEITCMLYCASVVNIDIDNCNFLTENTGIKSCFTDTDRDASICIKNCTLDNPVVFPHYNASFYNCRIKMPSYIWIALRNGLTATWENNTIEITNPTETAVSLTQVRGEGGMPLLVFRNNVFMGSIGSPVNKMSTINRDCAIIFENNKYHDINKVESKIFDELSGAFVLKGYAAN